VHNDVKEGGGMATEQAQSGAAGVAEGQTKAQEVASQAMAKAQEKAQDLRGQASERARGELDRRSTQLGEQVTSVVQALRRTGEQLHGEGNRTGARAAHTVAERAERLGGYLTGSDADRFLADAEGFGRRKPWLAAGGGAAVGFVVARFLRASAEGRYRSSRQVRMDSDAPLTRAGYEEQLPPYDTPAPGMDAGRY
jgi:ElaB/YqjD/DUF883 family membrane-anchored ribosome-binding protein